MLVWLLANAGSRDVTLLGWLYLNTLSAIALSVSLRHEISNNKIKSESTDNCFTIKNVLKFEESFSVTFEESQCKLVGDIQFGIHELAYL